MSENRACPKCKEIGRDKKDDHLWLMSDGVTWACLKPYHEPYYEREGESVEDRQNLTVSDIKKLPIVGCKSRMISKDTHEVFKVRSELSEVDRSQVALYYPETHKGKLISYKKRKLPKKFSVIHREGAKGTPDYFGQWRCPKNGKRLLICAGEEDTMAAYQMLHYKYPDAPHCVVGLPRGENVSDTIGENLHFTKNFDEIILAMDMDEAGRKAVAKIAPIFSNTVKTLLISEKDVHKMLVKGKDKEFINAYYSAKEYRPVNIICVSDILEEAVQPVPWGLSYPWDKLTRLTYGMKKYGEIIGLGAAPGAGKTTVWQQIQKHLIFEHDRDIAVFDVEEGPVVGLKKLIGSVMNRPIHKPDCEYDIEEAKRIGESFGKKAQFYNGDSESWDEVESAIRYFISKGIMFYFIDPLSALVEHLNPSDANTELGRIMRSMRKLRKHHGVTFFHANHLNNPVSGKEHGEGGKVLGSQFSGSRAQWKYSTLLMGFERNQLADDPEEKNLCVLQILKDRMGGNTGRVRMKYNQEKGILEEILLEDLI